MQQKTNKHCFIMFLQHQVDSQRALAATTANPQPPSGNTYGINFKSDCIQNLPCDLKIKVTGIQTCLRILAATPIGTKTPTLPRYVITF